MENNNDYCKYMDRIFKDVIYKVDVIDGRVCLIEVKIDISKRPKKKKNRKVKK